MKLFFETSHGSLNKYGEELCGDKVELRKCGGHVFMVVADGLGSGVKANILASLTSKIVITMLSEGASIPDIIETMSSTLPICKERRVAYSTFTFLHADPKGRAHIVEFDNPETILLRGGKSLYLERQSHTVGDKIIKEIHVDLQPGDQCILCSDGVIHAGVGKLLNLGWQHKNVVDYLEHAHRKDSTAHWVQSLLLSACNSLYMECPGDDTTVAVCHAKMPNTAYVMVGPPVNQEDDERLINEFLSFQGVKIVCGGTTSQIVSRLSGQELRTDIRYCTPKVPPIGHIQGIDLVTEGIITLGETLNILRRYETNVVGRDNLLSQSKDGATLLAQMLLEKCTGVRFLVGRALNPAHQNPDLPLDLNIKLKLVNDIADCLRRLDKEVDVEYH